MRRDRVAWDAMNGWQECGRMGEAASGLISFITMHAWQVSVNLLNNFDARVQSMCVYRGGAFRSPARSGLPRLPPRQGSRRMKNHAFH